MGSYPWHDKKNDLHIEVIRHHRDYEQPPTAEEIVQEAANKGVTLDLEEEKNKERDWERLIGKLGFVMKWPNSNHSGGGKGQW